MKIPYRWLREYVDLDLTPAQAAERLIQAGIEVAAIHRLAPAMAGVVVGVIEAVERDLGESRGHRLRVCRVSTGRDRFTVVCGAPNAAPGVRAAFAPPGALLPSGRVEVATIRGVASEGMLCSERELGLGDEHEAGVLVLDADAPPGADLRAYLGLDDDILEIEITPNRADCLAVVGVARELAALTGAPFRPPEIVLKEGDEAAADLARVRIEAPDLCARFTARVVSGVSVRPSPAWLAWRLRAVGLRPISNVVDVTNYVMWELGHPLHAFDYATVTDATIVVRRARPGEQLVTLDGQTRTLRDDMLVIADPARAIGLAGVMGGADTEVTARTTRVLLEAAWFQPASIRRTARALGLRTEAAYRFERGADIEGLVDASARAAQLLAEVAGGTVARGLVDVYPAPQPRPRVRLRMARVARVLGVAPPREEARRILAALGLGVHDAGAELEVEVPSFRRDLREEDDLVEEVVRVWGYDRIPAAVAPRAVGLGAVPPTLAQAATLRRVLVGAGLTEVVTWSFSDPAYEEVLRPAGGPPPLALANPLSRDASWLRYNPLEGVLGVIATNLRRQQPDVHVFELTKTFEPAPALATEVRWLVIALTGAREPLAWWARGEGGRREAVDVYDAKGLAELALEALGVGAVATRVTPAGTIKGFEPDCRAQLVASGDVVVAEFGEVAAEVRRLWDIGAPVFAAVLPLDTIARLTPPPVRHRPLPRFPAVHRDFAFQVGALRAVSAAEIEAALREEAGPLLRRCVLFDVFTFEDGSRSLAWRLTFQADDRTLTDEEVNAIQARVGRRVAERLQITWRGA